MRLAWSDVAKAELREVRAYSIARWSREVAANYLVELRDLASALAADPRRARPVKGRFHLFRVRPHFLIVSIDSAADILTIARVLHVTMDLDRHLP